MKPSEMNQMVLNIMFGFPLKRVVAGGLWVGLLCLPQMTFAAVPAQDKSPDSVSPEEGEQTAKVKVGVAADAEKWNCSFLKSR